MILYLRLIFTIENLGQKTKELQYVVEQIKKWITRLKYNSFIQLKNEQNISKDNLINNEYLWKWIGHYDYDYQYIVQHKKVTSTLSSR